MIGWVDTKVYDATFAATKDEIKAEKEAVGWCGQVLDTNGDGKITRPWNQQARGRGTVENVLYQGDTAGAGPAAAAGRGGPPAGRGQTAAGVGGEPGKMGPEY